MPGALRTLSKADHGMKVLYQNTRAHRVRFLQILLWGWAICVPAILYGQVQAGSQDDALVMAILTPILVLCAGGIEVYLRCYVVRLADRPEGLEMETMSTFGRASRVVPWIDVRLGRDLHDRFISGAAPSVNNTSTLLHLAGRQLPLIVDTTRDAVKLSSLKRRKPK